MIQKKTISYLIISMIYIQFSLPCSAMHEDAEDNQAIGVVRCSHWGLERWVCGIKEYTIDRCLCAGITNFKEDEPDRAYVNIRYAGEVTSSTDCLCIKWTTSESGVTFGRMNFCPMDFVGNSMCFPLAATIHILSLPFQCAKITTPNGAIIAQVAEREREKREARLRPRQVVVEPRMTEVERLTKELETARALEQLNKEADEAHANMIRSAQYATNNFHIAMRQTPYHFTPTAK